MKGVANRPVPRLSQQTYGGTAMTTSRRSSFAVGVAVLAGGLITALALTTPAPVNAGTATAPTAPVAHVVAVTIWDPQNADSYRYINSPTGYVLDADMSVVRGTAREASVFDGTEANRTKTFTLWTYETKATFHLQAAVAQPSVDMEDVADHMGSKPRPVCVIKWDQVTVTDSNAEPTQGWNSDGSGSYRNMSTCTLNSAPMTFAEMSTF